MKILLTALALIAIACVQAIDTHSPMKITEFQKAVKIEGLKNGNRGTRPKIVGGHEASPGQIPYQAGVDIDSYVFCGGSVIHDRYVLTTATCAYGGRTFTIYVGDVNLRRDASARQALTTYEAILHEKFDPSGFSYDIALLHLETSISFNTYVQPIKIASSGSYTGEKAVVSGWGSTYTGGDLVSTLQYAEVTTISNTDCQSVYGGVITDSHICTMPIGSSGGCFGDSGGPLTADDSGVVLIGISAFFDNHGCGYGPDGYTRMTTFYSWIYGYVPIK